MGGRGEGSCLGVDESARSPCKTQPPEAVQRGRPNEECKSEIDPHAFSRGQRHHGHGKGRAGLLECFYCFRSRSCAQCRLEPEMVSSHDARGW